MVIGDSMEVLLGIKRAAEEKCKVTVRSLNDVGDLVDCLTPIECILVCEPILNDVGEHDASAQRLCHARKKGGIHDG